MSALEDPYIDGMIERAEQLKLTEALKDLDMKLSAFESLSARDPIDGTADDLADSVRNFLNLLDSNFKETN